jgi:hypothetical protein
MILIKNLTLKKKNVDGYNNYIVFMIEMEKVEEDIRQLEEDAKKIDCHPICKFILDFFKCIKHTMRCCF